MAVGMMEIYGRDGADRPTLLLDRATRDSLAAYCARRWATNRRKEIQREWDLSPDEARGVMEATASASTVDKIWKHRRGGWSVVLPVLGAVIGQGVGEFFAAERERALHEAEQIKRDAERLAALESAAVRSFAPAARRCRAGDGAGLGSVALRDALSGQRGAEDLGSDDTGSLAPRVNREGGR